VRLSHLLDAAGVYSTAGAVRFTCFDGAYTESLTLKQARRADVLVALRMQDKDIGDSHGGPVRLYVAPMYFYKSAKRLSGITVTQDVESGFWYATWAAGATLVVLGTGLMMWFTHLTPLAWRTGATFVHDWLALTLGVVLAGPIGMALGDPEASRGMRTGSVTSEWAEREHPLWLRERKSSR
jgi:DMSO/TMAO reductase YedYZ molybdopterin-dependent catalytic subunit